MLKNSTIYHVVPWHFLLVFSFILIFKKCHKSYIYVFRGCTFVSWLSFYSGRTLLWQWVRRAGFTCLISVLLQPSQTPQVSRTVRLVTNRSPVTPSTFPPIPKWCSSVISVRSLQMSYSKTLSSHVNIEVFVCCAYKMETDAVSLSLATRTGWFGPSGGRNLLMLQMWALVSWSY